MTARDILRTAWHNVGRRRARTVLAATGVTVGIVVLVALLSLGVGVQREATRQLNRVGLEWVEVLPGSRSLLGRETSQERTHPLTASVVEEWQQRPDVVQVRTTINLPGSQYTSLWYGETALSVSLYERALSIDGPFEPEVQIIAGRDLRPGREGEIVLGQDVILHLRGEPVESFIGEEVTITLHAPRGEETTLPFTVVGITDAPYWEVRIGVKDRQKLKEWWLNETDLLETQGYDRVALRTHSIAEAEALAEELAEAGYNVSTTKMQFDMMKRGFLILEALMSSVGVLALFVAGIGIANTMVMAIYERTREIGLLKALGASRGEIRGLFISESSCIGLLGGIIGVILGWLLSLGLNELALLFFRWQQISVRGRFFLTTPGVVLFALFFGTMVGALAGLLPAARAARLDPVQALRSE